MILAALTAMMLPILVGIPRDSVGIGVKMQVTKTDGSDGGTVWGRVPSLEVGKQTTILLSSITSNCVGSIQFGGSFPPGAVSGWRIQITPLKVAEMDSVTFRLAWSKAVVDAKPSGASEESIELTLRPGESVPFDLQSWTAHASQGCGAKQTVLTVSVEPLPREMDRQLVDPLVDKVGGGAERTQRLTLRGRFGEVQRFYFDDINGTDRSLDLSGDVLVLAREDGVDLQITTQRRRMSYDGKARDTGSAHVTDPLASQRHSFCGTSEVVAGQRSLRGARALPGASRAVRSDRARDVSWLSRFSSEPGKTEPRRVE